MKKTVLILLILALTFPVFAQEAKNIMAGDILIGGDLLVSPRMTHYTYEEGGEEIAGVESTIFDLSINGLAGFFLVDSLEVGLEASFYYYNKKYKESENVNTSLSLYIGPQIGYFFNTYSNLVPYVGAVVLYYVRTWKSKPSSGEGAEENYSGYLIEPRAGLNLFLSDSVAFAPYIFFKYQTFTKKDTDPEEVDKWTEFGLRLGFNVFL